MFARPALSARTTPLDVTVATVASLLDQKSGGDVTASAFICASSASVPPTTIVAFGGEIVMPETSAVRVTEPSVHATSIAVNNNESASNGRGRHRGARTRRFNMMPELEQTVAIVAARNAWRRAMRQAAFPRSRWRDVRYQRRRYRCAQRQRVLFHAFPTSGRDRFRTFNAALRVPHELCALDRRHGAKHRAGSLGADVRFVADVALLSCPS